MDHIGCFPWIVSNCRVPEEQLLMRLSRRQGSFITGMTE
jgi:hypothetical protein